MSVSQSFDEFKAVVLANQGKYNAFPISFTINADLDTPVSAYLKVTSPQSPSFLLESVEGGEKRGRYSYIGTDPFEVLKQDNTDPLITLEARLKNIRCMPVAGLPNFSGGAVGYVSYDCVRHFEPAVKLPEKDTIGLPESVFLFCASLLVFDHVKHTVIVISHAMLDDKDLTEVALRAGYDAAFNRISQLSSRLSHSLPATALRSVHAPLSSQPIKTLPEMQSNVGKSGYEQMVDSLKVHIKKGDIFQAVPSQRVSVKLSSASAFDIYRQLRISNPSPYMFYFNFGDFEVLGASPEQLVKVENGKVTTHPIAGTRPRGKTPAEDEALAVELLANEKERAEHIMLVDLGRNDVGRVSQPGTVQVDSLMQIERYSHVMHIVSHVSGQLAQDKTPYDALRAVFPAGTLSGAPKIRAMQLIAGLEQQKRCIYGGAVGYVSFSGVLDVAIAIRTMVVKGGVAHLQAGGGVVYDSSAAEEYQESINKMMALYKAIERAEQVSAHFSESKEVAVSAREAPSNYERDIVMKNYTLPVTELSGTFGRFGGRYVPETLVGALEDLEREYIRVLNDAAFKEELRTLQKYYVGRPTPMYFAKRLTDHIGGPRIWLKREDLAHTGAHKINNALGQALVAKRMGKQRIIAETGAGQHGVATATACALLGLDCVVYMGAEDIGRQSLNVFRMKMLGAKVVPVTSGSRTLKDAVNEAMRDWVTNVRDTYYLIGSSIGPHPFPTIVRDFQCCIGEEVRAQMLERAGRLPDVAVACVGGGSNAIGLFHPLIGDKEVKLVGVEAGGEGVSSGKHAATIVGGTPGVLHGTRTFLLQDNNGQITETHSISAGLDYPGVGPEHAWLADTKRVQYVPVTDKEALEGLQIMTKFEGIIPALEPSHAIYAALQIAKTMRKDQDLLINLCGRGDKDMIQVAAALNVNLHG